MAQSKGRCERCGTISSKGTMLRHLQSCLGSERGVDAFLVRVESPGQLQYWMDVSIAAKALLLRLDEFLRAIWLECCGHLSEFTIRGERFIVAPEGNEPSMRVSAERVLYGVDGPFQYDYDFGSTTTLRLRVLGVVQQPAAGEPVRLLARNVPPAIVCDECDEPATSICRQCSWEDSVFRCEQHEQAHGSCEDEVWMPVVNSPRMGVCAYGWQPLER